MTKEYYVVSSSCSGSRNQRPLHTDPDCQALQRAGTVLGPKSRDVFDDDRPICSRCSGEADTGGGGRPLYQKLADPDTGPEALGL